MSNAFTPIQPALITWQNDLPFSEQYQDVYHSGQGGIGQCHYVFIQGNNLLERWRALEPDSTFLIGETGFGTGLNFLTTWKHWEEFAPASAKLHFISCDKHPLSLNDLIKSLSLWPELEGPAQELIANYPILTPGYHHLIFQNGRIKLTLMLGDAEECFEELLLCGDSDLEVNLRRAAVDAWYLDGFSPKKNEDMWSSKLVQIISLLSKKGTTLATYTASAKIKKPLLEHGFIIEKKKGFGPKRHMLCARLSLNASSSMKKRYTPWHLGAPPTLDIKKAIIIGAGMAGSFMASALAQRGWMVTVIDEKAEAGQGGSGNQAAVLFPKLSAYESPLTQLMLSAFLYSHKVYKDILRQKKIGEPQQLLLLPYNPKELKNQGRLSTWLDSYPQLGRLVDSTMASELAGIPIKESGLLIYDSAWVNCTQLCNFLLDNERIQVINNVSVDKLSHKHGLWTAAKNDAPILIMANGHKINSFNETQYLPVKPIRGQMTQIPVTPESQKLKVLLCGEAHVLPAINGYHSLGATYDLGVDDAFVNSADDAFNLAKLEQLASQTNWSPNVYAHWAGIRASTPDYLPLVGPIAKKEEFISRFSTLDTNSQRWLATSGDYYPGLYACAGFGSRGLTTIPLCAEWLAGFINNEVSCLPRTLIQALSPSRFLRRSIIRGLI